MRNVPPGIRIISAVLPSSDRCSTASATVCNIAIPNVPDYALLAIVPKALRAGRIGVVPAHARRRCRARPGGGRCSSHEADRSSCRDRAAARPLTGRAAPSARRRQHIRAAPRLHVRRERAPHRHAPPAHAPRPCRDTQQHRRGVPALRRRRARRREPGQSRRSRLRLGKSSAAPAAGFNASDGLGVTATPAKPSAAPTRAKLSVFVSGENGRCWQHCRPPCFSSAASSSSVTSALLSILSMSGHPPLLFIVVFQR